VSRPVTRRDLSGREIEILQAAADGYSIAETAYIHHLTLHTVKDHRARILSALAARSTTHAVAIAMREGLIQ
jgi:DNA-binding NarL/FixJ family response regulator